MKLGCDFRGELALITAASTGMGPAAVRAAAQSGPAAAVADPRF